MRAAFYEANGPAAAVLRVGDVATPEPWPGEVRIRLAASGVNPSDVKSREGRTRKIAFPRVIPHSDGAGVIDKVGSGVAPARVGERVWVWNAQWKRAHGTAAEYVVLPAALAVPLPDHIGFAEGACLGIPAMTAYHAVATAQADSAATVLVSGGAGGVGHYAIQFAKARGAVVIATISSAEKAKLARAAGADHVIDYKREDVAGAVMDLTDNGGIDAVIEMDLAANARLYPGLLHPRSRVVVYGTGAAQAQVPAQFLLVNAISIDWIFVYELTAEERAAAIGAITQGMAQNQLIHNVALTVPLGDVVRAHEAVEQGAAAGNVVLTIP
ncbi:MAG TPA: NADPH:quinone reductase [Xanthobacteraceae bacterium]|nr:NADPH:quinone reductase [Xanthobacteraceae bacterium]